jgi:hypothetical protein
VQNFAPKKKGWSLVLMNEFDFPLGTYIVMYILCQLMQIGEKLVNVPKGLEQGVCHTVALPITVERILRQKKNYGNSKISPCKNILIFKKSSKRSQNPSKYYNSITNLKFQHKPKCHVSKILL